MQDATVKDQGERGLSLLWAARMSPGPVALSLGLGILVFYLGGHALNGTFFALGQGGAATGLVRMDFVFGLLFVYSGTIGVVILRTLDRDMAILAEIVEGGSEETDRLANRLLHVRPLHLGVTLGLGGLLGFFVATFAPNPAFENSVLGETGNFLHVVLEVGLFMLLGVLGLTGLEHSKALADLGRSRCFIDLFHEEPRKAFARSGMRIALAWTGGTGISLMLLLDSALSYLVASILFLSMGMGVLSLYLSCRGIRHAVRAEKARCLSEIRRSLAVEMNVFIAAIAPPMTPSPTLGALVAAESRIEAVAEWPLDSALARRFGLILLVPLLSWTGGALVERLVDSAFG